MYLSVVDWTEITQHLHMFIFTRTLLIRLIHKPFTRKCFEVILTNQPNKYTASTQNPQQCVSVSIGLIY
jgi:hypothetical protein